MLRAPFVGHAKSANLATGPGLPNDPICCVKTVVGIVDQGPPVSLGSITTAHILNDDHVAVRYAVADCAVRQTVRSSNRIVRGYPAVGILKFLVIGSPLHQHWELPIHRCSIPRWPVDIRGQTYAIT